MNSIAIFSVLFSILITQCLSHGYYRNRQQKYHSHGVSSKDRSHHTYRDNVSVREPVTTLPPTELPPLTTLPPTELPPLTTLPAAPTTTLPVITDDSPPAPNVKAEEGLFLGIVDKFHTNEKPKQQYKPYNKKVYKPYEKTKNDEMCYEIITSDDSYSHKKDLSFKDISSTCQGISFGGNTYSSATITLSNTYKFYGEDIPSTISVTTSGTLVLDSNSFGSAGANVAAANLGNKASKPFSVIAPFWSAFSMDSGLNAGTVCWQEFDDELIVQWEVNEYQESTTGGIFQVRLYSDCDDIIYSYKQLNCYNPTTGTAQFGVKPSQGKFAEGQRSSNRLSSCINGAYQFPRDNTGVWLKPAKCNELIGQTGIRKPQKVKKEYKKNDKKQSYEKNSDIDRYFHRFLDHVFHL